MKRKGVVYTPGFWADWAVRSYGIAEKWMEGKTILDPGCGRGALTSAIIRRALKLGFSPSPEDMKRLICIDKDKNALSFFRDSLPAISGMPLPEISIRTSDYLLEAPEIRADIVFSNPPWISFGDLDNEDKEKYKPLFRDSGLVPDPRTLLLGGSRIDLAALFVVVSLNRDTGENGEGFFFLPVSLFRSEGAHSAFRQLRLPGGRFFALREIRDMRGGVPFPGAGTAYCLASYRADRQQQWPVAWFQTDVSGNWIKMEAEPADGPDSPLMPRPSGSERISPPRIHVPRGTVPRQGVNTQGASGIFHIMEIDRKKNGLLHAISKNGFQGILPEELVYPMMSSSSFNRENITVPDRWIFMPYKRDGRVMNRNELETFPEALEWLEHHRETLKRRRGMMLKKVMEKGIYWALIGVGPYTFAPWKLAWESYGKNRFLPKLFHSETGIHWQGNQALHAYLPFYDEKAAKKALKDFSSPELEDYLKKLGGAGTKNWAQPGRIRRLLREYQ